MADLWGVGQLHYLVPFGRCTWGAGLYALAMRANGNVLFAEFFFDHVTKPMVWGHNLPMDHTGAYFCFP